MLAVAAVYFLLPLLAAAEFSLRAPGGGYGLANWLAIAGDPVLLAALGTSLQIAVITAVVVLALVVPTAVWVRLQIPGLAGALESATILPIVIPPVVMAAGIAFVQANLGGPAFRALFASSTAALTPFYVILALPFAYRAVDNGSPRSRSGRSWRRPATWARAWPRRCCGWCCRRSAARCWARRSSRWRSSSARSSSPGSCCTPTRFPVAIVEVGRSRAGVAVALSLASLLVTWVLLLAVSLAGSRRTRRGSS